MKDGSLSTQELEKLAEEFGRMGDKELEHYQHDPKGYYLASAQVYGVLFNINGKTEDLENMIRMCINNRYVYGIAEHAIVNAKQNGTPVSTFMDMLDAADTGDQQNVDTVRRCILGIYGRV